MFRLTSQEKHSPSHAENSLFLAMQILNLSLHDTVVGTGIDPNKPPKVACKHNLELSILWNAPFAAGFLKINLNFRKRQNAPFWAYFSGMIT